MANAARLLGPDDPDPVEVLNASGSAPFVLTCEHAGRAVPDKLGDLGIPPCQMERHIAWDIGAAGVARLLSAALDAPLISQRYSRLVIDCNRPAGVLDHILEISDGTTIPGNTGLRKIDRDARHAEIHDPFHRAVSDLLDVRRTEARPTALIAIHSFTPMLLTEGVNRPWDIGVLYNRDRTLSTLIYDALADQAGHLNLAYNEPYVVEDHGDFTIPVHGEKRGIRHTLFEIRNDHIAHAAGQRTMARILAQALARVAPHI
ncbi:MAG TPA: N-formylglutamate amidohydrolase [Thermohalobaculum sp.]|nr:N-formylglutamate amidohydrolase [Thermohalobaculum sp.]